MKAAGGILAGALSLSLLSLMALTSGAQVSDGVSPILTCASDDTQVTTFTTYDEFAGASASPEEALEVYLGVVDLAISANAFDPVDDPVTVQSADEQLGLESADGTVALADIESVPDGGWRVNKFTACYAWEQKH